MKFWKTWPYPAKLCLGLTLFFAATLGFAVLRGNSSHHKISLESLSITPSEQSAWENKPKVVYFWATWCTVCKAYSYILPKNLKLLGENTLFLSIVEDEDSNVVKEYVQAHNIHYPVIQGKYDVFRDWGVNAFPTTIFLNQKDEVLFFDTGIISPISFWIRSFLTERL